MSNAVSERNQQRRRVLRAAAAAPVVLTLPSGAALANTSLTCAQKSKTRYDSEIPGPSTFTGGEDAWMRIELQRYMIVVNPADPAVPGFQHNGLWFQVLDGDTAVQVVPHSTMPGDPNAPTPVVGQYYYGLIDYHSTGSELIISKSPGINPIAGASCWNSLSGSMLTRNVL